MYPPVSSDKGMNYSNNTPNKIGIQAYLYIDPCSVQQLNKAQCQQMHVHNVYINTTDMIWYTHIDQTLVNYNNRNLLHWNC